MSMSTFVLNPVKGRLLRDTETRVPLQHGERKPRNTYYLRAVKAGDAVVVNNVKSKESKDG